MPWLGTLDLVLSVVYTLLLVGLLVLTYRALTSRDTRD
jgi:hypothetical protein